MNKECDDRLQGVRRGNFLRNLPGGRFSGPERNCLCSGNYNLKFQLTYHARGQFTGVTIGGGVNYNRKRVTYGELKNLWRLLVTFR